MQSQHLLLLCCLVAALSLSTGVAALEGTTNLYASPTASYFHSNGQPDYYGNGWNWSWIIHSDHFVKFKFYKYDVEDCCDKVYVYSHYTSSTGGKLQFTAESDYEKGKCEFTDCKIKDYSFILQGPIRLRFVTDGSVVKRGFYFFYVSRSYSFGCNSTDVRGDSGYFRHRTSYVLSYGNNWDCRRVIRTNRIIRLSFLLPDVEYNHDKVYLYQNSGSVSSSKLHSVVSSRSDYGRSYYLQGPVLVRFKTDGSVTKKGFHVFYGVYECSSSHLHSSSGTFKSQLSENYGNNWNCMWVIHSRRTLRLNFNYADVEFGSDQVYLYEETASVSTRKLYKTLTSSSDFSRTYYLQGPVLVRFKTDGSVTKSGFQVSYRTMNSSYGCSSSVSLYSTSGVIRSQPPGMKTYKNNWDCSWRLRHRNRVYRLHFQSHDLQLPHDRVFLYERADFARANASTIVLSSSSQFSGRYSLRGPVVIRFRTDSSEVRTGFRLSYSSSESRR